MYLLNENEWFLEYQPELVKFANTSEGRDVLCIPHTYPKVVGMRKNEVRCLLEERDDDYLLMSDFRVGAKWGNVIRHRWDEWLRWLKWCDHENSVLQAYWRLPLQMAALTLTTYPDPNPETTTVDGDVNYNPAVKPSWASLHDATSGSTANSSTSPIYIGIDASAITNKWDSLWRIIELFDTSTLTSQAVVSSVVHSNYGVLKQDTLGAASAMHSCSSNPASNTNITPEDYDQLGTTSFGNVTYANFSTSGYNDVTLNASGLGAVSATGITKLGLRLSHDILNTSPTWSSADIYLGVASAEATGTANDPKLVVTYTLPVSSSNHFFLGADF